MNYATWLTKIQIVEKVCMIGKYGFVQTGHVCDITPLGTIVVRTHNNEMTFSSKGNGIGWNTGVKLMPIAFADALENLDGLLTNKQLEEML